MNTGVKSPYRKQFLWPLLGVMAGALVACNSVYPPQLTFGTGMMVLFVTLGLVFGLSWHPAGTRIAAVLAGMAMVVPCFVRDSSLERFFLMCMMAILLAMASALVLIPADTGFRARLAYLSTWGGTHPVTRGARRFDATALIQIVAATVVFAAGLAVLRQFSNSGPGLVMRWLSGGVMIMAFAELITAGPVFVAAGLGLGIPPLMRSPHLSASINEFWTKRWNLFASQMVFRPYCFLPFARLSVGAGLFAAFAASAVIHLLLAFMAFGQWGISLACGAFFVVQPFFIIAERRLNVRRWSVARRRLWTVSALAIASPLFVEPVLRLIEGSGCTSGPILPPVLLALGFVAVFSVVVSLAALACGPDELTGAAPRVH